MPESLSEQPVVDITDALATAEVLADGPAADAVANLARSFLAQRQQTAEMLKVVRKAPRFYPSQSTDGWFIMREEEEELPGDWVEVAPLLAELRRIVALGSRPTQTAEG